jgi:hypothetical protein
MPTYIYRTIPSRPDMPVRQFELRQPMSAPPLTTDPETGEPVERVITGGLAPLTTPRGGEEPTISGGCGPTCGCH